MALRSAPARAELAHTSHLLITLPPESFLLSFCSSGSVSSRSFSFFLFVGCGNVVEGMFSVSPCGCFYSLRPVFFAAARAGRLVEKVLWLGRNNLSSMLHCGRGLRSIYDCLLTQNGTARIFHNFRLLYLPCLEPGSVYTSQRKPRLRFSREYDNDTTKWPFTITTDLGLRQDANRLGSNHHLPRDQAQGLRCHSQRTRMLSHPNLRRLSARLITS